MIGQMVGNYKIVEKLGEGGMGAVFKAVDTMLEREVAIKMLRPEIASQPEVVERFRSEAVTLAKLNHPSIAMLYSFFRQGDQLFMVMEYVPGRTLESVLRDSGALAWEQAVEIVCRVLEGIEHAHAHGILHRDLKPANIMLTASGGVKVMDFGIARILGAARMTRAGRIVGTIEYIAPERVRGQEADIRSDLYSLGVVLYEMLCGKLPFDSESEFDLMRAHIEQAPPPLENLGLNLPAGLCAAVTRALAKNPDDRFGSTSEFSAALEAVARQAPAPAAQMVKPTRLAAAPAVKPTRLAPQPAAVPVVAPAPAAQAAARKPKWALYGAAAAVLAVVVGGGAFFAFRKPAPAPAQAPQPAATQVAQNVPQGGVAPLAGNAPLGAAPDMQSGQKAEDILKSALPMRGAEAPRETVPRQAAPRETAPAARPVPARNGQAAQPAAANHNARQAAPVAAAPVTAPAAQVPAAQVPTAPVPAAPAPQAQPPAAPPAAPPAPAAQPVPQSAPPAAVHSRTVTLQEVRTLYVEPMPNDFHTYIGAEIVRQLGSRIQLVPARNQADAVMSGTGELRGGAAGAVTGRVLGVQSDAQASVMITDRAGKQVLWTGEAQGRSILGGVVRKGGPAKVAERLVSNLKKALR